MRSRASKCMAEGPTTPDTKQEPDNIMRRIVRLPEANVRKGEDAAAAAALPAMKTFCAMGHLGNFFSSLSYTRPIHPAASYVAASKVVSDFQRWSVDFLLYLPAFIENKNARFFQEPRRCCCIVHRESPPPPCNYRSSNNGRNGRFTRDKKSNG